MLNNPTSGSILTHCDRRARRGADRRMMVVHHHADPYSPLIT